MPSLKDLKVRINSVKSTQKITSAMKMVAASKLRRAQEQVEASRPYALRMERMLTTLSASFSDDDHVSSGDDEGRVPRMIKGTGSDQVHLIVVVTSDRGLCGAFNSGIVREVRKRLHELKKDGKTVKIITVGRKGRDILRREFSSDIVESHDEVGKRRTLYAEADAITQKVLALFKAKEFDVCTVYFNQFKSVISQVVTAHQLLPIPRPKVKPKTQGPRDLLARDEDVVAANDVPFMFEFDPDEEVVLKSLLPHHMKIQIYRALLESSASEQGARMTAMDNATRNAGEMIQKLTLNYNRTRQAVITKELIEIISGAEAL